MATLATPRGSDRSTTGARIAHPSAVERGSIVLTGDRFVVAWTPAGTGWVALPIAKQTGPLHRSDVVVWLSPRRDGLGITGRALVRTAAPVLIAGEAVVVGHLDRRMVESVDVTLRRAAEAHAFEDAHLAGA
jgi:hypothetical protein